MKHAEVLVNINGMVRNQLVDSEVLFYKPIDNLCCQQYCHNFPQCFSFITHRSNILILCVLYLYGFSLPEIKFSLFLMQNLIVNKTNFNLFEYVNITWWTLWCKHIQITISCKVTNDTVCPISSSYTQPFQKRNFLCSLLYY